MIDIVTEQELNLKNVTQIGTPSEEEKIYIEDAAYARIHMDDFQEMRVFVLMGHTTCTSGRYTTFVEAALPVRDIEFDHRTPLWTNWIWNEVFHEIKYSYEKSIIVGWAFDIKGIPPAITPELEAIHREHFGGVHQVLFLVDTVGTEEYFYLNKSNHLYRKDGFYIYYNANKKRIPQPRQELKRQGISSEYFVNRRNRMEQRPETDQKMAWKNEQKSGHSSKMSARQLLMEQQSRSGAASGSKTSAFGVVVAVALLVGIVATSFYKNPQQLDKFQQIITTFGNRINTQDKQQNHDIIYISTESASQTEKTPTEAEETENQAASELQETTESKQQSTEASAAVIPVEKIDGGIPSGNESPFNDN